jgi:hypothetical protein
MMVGNHKIKESVEGEYWGLVGYPVFGFMAVRSAYVQSQSLLSHFYGV